MSYRGAAFLLLLSLTPALAVEKGDLDIINRLLKNPGITITSNRALRDRCVAALADYIYDNREQSLAAIEQLRQILSSLKQVGAGTEAKLRVLQKILTHYGQFDSEVKDRFEVVSEMLTLLGTADTHTFMAFSGVLHNELHRYGVLESDGFLYYTSGEILVGDLAQKTPAIKSPHVLVINSTEYVSQLVELMNANQLRKRMKEWNITAIQLVSLDSRLTLFPVIVERGTKNIEMLSAWLGRHYSRGNGIHSESEEESHLIKYYVHAPYARFATDKIKTLGIRLESVLSSGEMDETVQALLSLLGYRVEPQASRGLYWIQDVSNEPSTATQRLVGKKALAMFRTLFELKLTVTTYKAFLAGPKSQLDQGESLRRDPDLFSGGNGSNYFKPVVPVEKYRQVGATFNIHCHPVPRNWVQVDGVSVPWGIEAGIGYLQENGYQYSVETDKWILP